MKKEPIINRKGVEKRKQLSQETLDFLKKSKEFLEKNNIEPKKFEYKSGMSFLEYNNEKKDK